MTWRVLSCSRTSKCQVAHSSRKQKDCRKFHTQACDNFWIGTKPAAAQQPGFASQICFSNLLAARKCQDGGVKGISGSHVIDRNLQVRAGTVLQRTAGDVCLAIDIVVYSAGSRRRRRLISQRVHCADAGISGWQRERVADTIGRSWARTRNGAEGGGSRRLLSQWNRDLHIIADRLQCRNIYVDGHSRSASTRRDLSRDRYWQSCRSHGNCS